MVAGSLFFNCVMYELISEDRIVQGEKKGQMADSVFT